MSKEGNTEELQRWAVWDQNDHVEDKDGMWVRFSDVEEREARIKALSEALDAALYERRAEARRLDAAYARIEELDAECNRRANDVDQMTVEIEAFLDARWRERIQKELAIHADAIESARKCGCEADQQAVKELEAGQSALRSLLDSGEESNEECQRCGGFGYADVYEPCDAPVSKRYECPTCRATPSTALHREGREAGQSDVAVPEKVEVNREDLRMAVEAASSYDTRLPEGQGTGELHRLRAALAAFRATEEPGQ